MDIITLPVGTLETNCYIVSLPDRNDCIVIDPGDEYEKILAAANGKEIAAVKGYFLNRSVALDSE